MYLAQTVIKRFLSGVLIKGSSESTHGTLTFKASVCASEAHEEAAEPGSGGTGDGGILKLIDFNTRG